MPKKTKRFLIAASLLFLAIEFYRLYMLYRMRTTDLVSLQHIMLALLSILISGNILRIIAKGNNLIQKDALSLIKSGGLLASIWSYRAYLILRTVKNPLIRKVLTYVSFTYILLSLLIMASGFKIKRSTGKDLITRQDNIS